jgi:recombinational DNA repair ATPase RecF
LNNLKQRERARGEREREKGGRKICFYLESIIHKCDEGQIFNYLFTCEEDLALLIGLPKERNFFFSFFLFLAQPSQPIPYSGTAIKRI